MPGTCMSGSPRPQRGPGSLDAPPSLLLPLGSFEILSLQALVMALVMGIKRGGSSFAGPIPLVLPCAALHWDTIRSFSGWDTGL